VIGIILSDRASFDRALSLFCLTFLHYGMRVFFTFERFLRTESSYCVESVLAAADFNKTGVPSVELSCCVFWEIKRGIKTIANYGGLL